MNRTLRCIALLCLASTTSHAEWVDLLAEVDADRHAVQGAWSRGEDGLQVDAAQGARLALPYAPPKAYDFRVKFTRRTGVHSIALMFAMGDGSATFEIDAWGQHLAGIQNINGQTLQQNATRRADQRLTNGRPYVAEVRVRGDRVTCYLDGDKIADYTTDGSDLRVLDAWRLPNDHALGVGAWDAATVFHAIEVREIEGEGKTIDTSPAPPPAPVAAPGNVLDMGEPPATQPPATQPAARATNKRVLLIIANDGFFYREYADPRDELLRAGIAVDVAAGFKAPCVPHPGSGQGDADGRVTPDLSIAEADPSRYDAIVFSGGWGSSMYQYAFQGRYDNNNYNGNREIKRHANRLINAMARDDKYIGGICHGVSVLAWSRVGGQSLLRGKRVAAPQRDGPRGIYNGTHQQPPSRWSAQVNGADLTEPRSIGDPRTSVDDVAVDGKILTAEDDRAARLLGRTLARLLTQ